MNTFNKKSLCVALAATGMLGAAGVAQAVNVSESGLGNVLIYPYYTVNNDVNGNAFNTLMSVVNTTGSTKAIKVRFREGRNSVEVLDFNVFLSPFDVWSAAITPTAAGGAQIATVDTSCTIPDFKDGEAVAFRTLSFDKEDDNAVTRTSEGYFEVFEMATYTTGSAVAINSLHKNGVPVDCGKVTNASAQSGIAAPSGGLFGGAIILSPAGGGAFSTNATALANFTSNAAYFTTGTESPNYDNAFPEVSNVIAGSNLYKSNWTNGTDAVTAALMANAVINEYVLDAGSKSQTTWVLTFPTKSVYDGSDPFTESYEDGKGACENFYGVVFNREEGSPQIVSEDDFSPTPEAGKGPTLCWEAQNLSFGTSNVFGSRNNASLSTTNPSTGEVFSNGWAVIGFNDLLRDKDGTPLVDPSGRTRFDDEHALVNDSTTIVDLTGSGTSSGVTVTYHGLPVIGFAAITFQNDAITVNGKTFLSTFGATYSHRLERVVSDLPPL